jgi:DNA-binding transcriptional ArsR family regulator
MRAIRSEVRRLPEFVQTAVKGIDELLRALKDERARLEAARAALVDGPRPRHRAANDGTKRTAARPSSRPDGGSRTPRARRSGNTRANQARRNASGSTRTAVLAAFTDGDALTAAQVADKTGLGRATVSTTLSRLAKTGAIEKADRGYRRSPNEANGASAPAQAAPTE